MPPDAKSAALWWAARGVPVFPCDPKTKKPLTKNGFKDASTEVDQIEYWWRERPKALIGAPCGSASGLLPIDIDVKGPTPPREIVEGLRAEFDLPQCPLVATKSGGFHIYFSARPGVARKIRWRDQIDILGEGGFVILPPSDGYKVVCNAPMIDFPEGIDLTPKRKTNGHANGSGNALAQLLAAAHEPGQWHDSVRNAVAKLYSMGTRASVIVDLLAPQVTIHPYTEQETRADIIKMVDGCKQRVDRGEWDSPRNGDGAIRFIDFAKGGKLLPTYSNTRTALVLLSMKTHEDPFEFSYERFADRGFYKPGQRITDESISGIRQLIIDRFEFDPDERHTRAAVKQLCWENSHNRVCDMLNALEWDGTERLNSWLSDYMGAAETALHAMFGRKTLIAAVRRARAPGTKFDGILLLQGPQGAGKSTAIRILAGEPELFSDQDILHLDARAQQENVQGRWFYELSELAGMAKADIDRVKAFCSRTHDRARAAFGHFLEDKPRACVFIATTNAKRPLRDATGNRRFWPVKVRNVLLDAFTRDRGQLLAEAAVAEASGESLILPEELWTEAEQAQEQCLEDDPWFDILTSLRGVIKGDIEQVAITAAMDSLSIPRERQTRAVFNRLTEVMERLGWERAERVLWLGGKPARGFERQVRLGKIGQENDDDNQ